MPPDDQSADPAVSSAIAADVAAIGRIGAIGSILEIACRSTGMRFAAVARVTADSWTACAVRDEIAFGLGVGGELPILTTICHEIQQNHVAVVIDHVAEDPLFRDHHTPRLYGFQSYVSVPIFRKSGEFFGTLCAIDPAPAQLRATKAIATFEAFAELISEQLETENLLLQSQAQLLDAHETAELREQFIAVIGHDLRNPLSAVNACAEALLRMSLPELQNRLAQTILSSSQRMAGLVDNLLDFARGRLGGGIALDRQIEGNLALSLQRVIAEVAAIHPHRGLRVDLDCEQPVYCDADRIAQILSNLLANAYTHGDPRQGVAVCARVENDEFTLAVTNQGPPIPAERIPQLFQPFFRHTHKAQADGLGLGLFIAAELARAHEGRIEVDSGEAGTTFSLRFPAQAPAGAPDV